MSKAKATELYAGVSRPAKKMKWDEEIAEDVQKDASSGMSGVNGDSCEHDGGHISALTGENSSADSADVYDRTNCFVNGDSCEHDGGHISALTGENTSADSADVYDRTNCFVNGDSCEHDGGHISALTGENSSADSADVDDWTNCFGQDSDSDSDYFYEAPDEDQSRSPERQVPRGYSLSAADLEARRKREEATLAEELGVSAVVAREWLVRSEWDLERARESARGRPAPSDPVIETGFCGWCLEDVRSDANDDARVTFISCGSWTEASCEHAMHKQCARAYAECRIDDLTTGGSLDQWKGSLPCPACHASRSTAPGFLSAQQVGLLTTAPQLEAFERKRGELLAQGQRWCPEPGCGGVLVAPVLRGIATEVECAECRRCSCAECGEPPHEPATCQAMRKLQRLHTAYGSVPDPYQLPEDCAEVEAALGGWPADAQWPPQEDAAWVKDSPLGAWFMATPTRREVCGAALVDYHANGGDDGASGALQRGFVLLHAHRKCYDQESQARLNTERGLLRLLTRIQLRFRVDIPELQELRNFMRPGALAHVPEPELNRARALSLRLDLAVFGGMGWMEGQDMGAGDAPAEGEGQDMGAGDAPAEGRGRTWTLATHLRRGGAGHGRWRRACGGEGQDMDAGAHLRRGGAGHGRWRRACGGGGAGHGRAATRLRRGGAGHGRWRRTCGGEGQDMGAGDTPAEGEGQDMGAGDAPAEGEGDRYVAGVTKDCPGCHRFVEKEFGCPHMTCVCGCEWCWDCRLLWQEVGGYQHECSGMPLTSSLTAEALAEQYEAFRAANQATAVTDSGVQLAAFEDYEREWRQREEQMHAMAPSVTSGRDRENAWQAHLVHTLQHRLQRMLGYLRPRGGHGAEASTGQQALEAAWAALQHEQAIRLAFRRQKLMDLVHEEGGSCENAMDFVDVMQAADEPQEAVMAEELGVSAAVAREWLERSEWEVRAWSALFGYRKLLRGPDLAWRLFDRTTLTGHTPLAQYHREELSQAADHLRSALREAEEEKDEVPDMQGWQLLSAWRLESAIKIVAGVYR
ncbi:hypothetical protein CYMTET_21161 [Cymbomonas tetramitiformis]|uniref:IBR domain-containing protein n=1 Tax=Cymbomonas tetramitiformis TaxID=36881 RepID=A0AAE0G2G6_9CHLO|nr:hypothetical protein CYMTET_21161 [Cymbomonas tetramitiformis]